MKKAGFNVPDGIVLDAEEYRSFVKKNGIADKISELMNKLTAENAQATGEAVEALFAGLKADEETISKIASMTDDSKSYAVQTSRSFLLRDSIRHSSTRKVLNPSPKK